jgi:hypothetical protein
MGRPRPVHAGGLLWIIAADAPFSQYGPEHIERGLRNLSWVSERALAHEAVVEFFARGAPTIPMKLFTLFSTDARAVAHIRKRRESLQRVFRRIAGRQEWGVRVYFDPATALASPESRVPRDRRARSRPQAARQAAQAESGTLFLLRKQEEQTRLSRSLRQARVDAGRIFRQLADHAAAVRRHGPHPGEGRTTILLDAAFLVDAGKAGRFRRLAEGVGARLAGGGCHLTLTGPWPAYNFVSVRGRA